MWLEEEEENECLSIDKRQQWMLERRTRYQIDILEGGRLWMKESQIQSETQNVG